MGRALEEASKAVHRICVGLALLGVTGCQGPGGTPSTGLAGTSDGGQAAAPFSGSGGAAGRAGAGAGWAGAVGGRPAAAGSSGHAGVIGGASGGSGGLPATDPGRLPGIWISPAEIMALPVSGPAWNAVADAAASSSGTPKLSDQDQNHNVLTLAKAFVCVRLGDTATCDEVRRAVMAAPETENGGRTLALGRELLAYVIAADLVGLDPAHDARWRHWLTGVLTEELSGRTLVSTHEDRPNNWGTHAGASRLAAAVYLGDRNQVERCAQVFRGWLGDRSSYAGFAYGDLFWQADPAHPVGVNPKGSTKQGHNIDGVVPDDQRRGGGFVWPPPKENYVWEALQGALAQAVILHRQGYDVWNWQDQALRRAVAWLHSQAGYPAEGDDTWQPHLVNYFYGTHFPAPIPSRPGKNLGYTDWTHAQTPPSPYTRISALFRR